MSAMRSVGYWWAVFLLLAFFVWAGWQTMLRPLNSGEIYPPYSTLRSDPLGSKALFESLAEQPQLQVSRLYRSRDYVNPQSTLFLLGLQSGYLASASNKSLDEYKNLVQIGGRVVIGFLPEYAPAKEPITKDIEERWHVKFRHRKASDAVAEESEMPKTSALYFEPGTEWRTLRARGEMATMIERDFGKGTLVLVADSYPLSNQGLSELNDSAMIAALVGNSREALFDESHLGVSETGSVAVLMRKYRLQGALTMILVIAILFIWRNACGFLPSENRGAGDSVLGRESSEGLAALLRRSVPDNDLLRVCFREWSQSASRSHRAKFVEEAVSRWAGRDPVEGYRAASRALKERK